MKSRAIGMLCSGGVAAILMMWACAPAMSLEAIPGKISIQLGISSAQESNVFTGESSGSQTTAAYGADYQYPLGEHFRIGASLLHWSFDAVGSGDTSHGGTSLCANGTYAFGKNQSREVFLGIGSDLVRIGYRNYFSNEEEGKGIFASIEFDAPTNDDVVDTFGGIAVGYSF